jgi:hypothetical protein
VGVVPGSFDIGPIQLPPIDLAPDLAPQLSEIDLMIVRNTYAGGSAAGTWPGAQFDLSSPLFGTPAPQPPAFDRDKAQCVECQGAQATADLAKFELRQLEEENSRQHALEQQLESARYHAESDLRGTRESVEDLYGRSAPEHGEGPVRHPDLRGRDRPLGGRAQEEAKAAAGPGKGP